MVYVDSSGKRLTDYPRPSVAVDTALLTVDPEAGLSVLLVRRSEAKRTLWALPGTFLHEGERLADAVRRSLRDKAGVTGLEPKQLTVLDDPRRDDRGWVLSVAHLETVRFDTLVDVVSETDEIVIRPCESLPRLAFDHRAVVTLAVEALREQYSEHPDPRHLLTEPFTLAELQRLHEAVAGTEFQRDTFRRQMEPQLVDSGEVSAGTVGRPARLFTRA
jgi:ADP-ribose pyrophosphatase YjhB (NUDIX family)